MMNHKYKDYLQSALAFLTQSPPPRREESKSAAENNFWPSFLGFMTGLFKSLGFL